MSEKLFDNDSVVLHKVMLYWSYIKVILWQTSICWDVYIRSEQSIDVRVPLWLH